MDFGELLLCFDKFNVRSQLQSPSSDSDRVFFLTPQRVMSGRLYCLVFVIGDVIPHAPFAFVDLLGLTPPVESKLGQELK